MKKFFLFVTAISISLAVMSQKGNVTSALSYIDQGMLDKAKEAIDQALTNEKTRNWFNTFYAKGRLCQAVFESDNPEFKAYYPDPLAEAYTAYEKALELDTKGTLKKKMITTMVYNTLTVDLFSQGSSRFEADDFEGALKSFETQIKITEGDKYAGAIDTGMYFNAGLAAVNAKKYSEAIIYFEKCTEMQYLGITPFVNISDSYLGLGDTARAESVLQSLSVKFPDNKDLILQLIDIYIKSNNNDEALRYINIAKESDPTNYRLYLASGIIYLNQNRYDEAINDLARSIEIKSDLFDTQYAMGIAYINKAADMNTKANEIMDIKKYNEAVDQLNTIYANALPFMEKANELKPDDFYTMSRLQELYYRLRTRNPDLSQKYLYIKEKLDAIEGN